MYITIAQAETLLGRIINVYEDSGVVDEDHLQLVIDEAEGMVNAAIASRYTIPVTETNALSFIRGLVVPILRYKSYTQFNEQEDFPKGILEEYKATLKVLKDLATQVISLPDEDEKITGRASHIKINSNTSPIEKY